MLHPLQLRCGSSQILISAKGGFSLYPFLPIKPVTPLRTPTRSSQQLNQSNKRGLKGERDLKRSQTGSNPAPAPSHFPASLPTTSYGLSRLGMAMRTRRYSVSVELHTLFIGVNWWSANRCIRKSSSNFLAFYISICNNIPTGR